jgi:cytoskeletal protein CcmA (bactofilin family)
MGNETRNDLNVSGSMTLPGGVFNNIVVNGSLKLSSAVECKVIKIHGLCTIDGAVKAEKGRVHGRAAFTGNLESGEFKIMGKLEVDGSAKVKIVHIHGMAEIEGNVLSEKIVIFGALKTKGDCNAEDFVSQGAFTIDGLLNAANIDVNYFGKCKVKEIGGEKISIQRGRKYKFIRLRKIVEAVLNFQYEGFTAESIEGDDIYLEYTKAKVVRGNNIVIGPGCEIDLVEYKNNYKEAKGAFIKSSKKV